MDFPSRPRKTRPHYPPSRDHWRHNTSTDYRYYLASRLDQLNVNGDIAADCAYDSNSNRLSVTSGTGAGATTESGTYDAQDRLLTYAGHTYTWTANGELATRTHVASGAQLTTVYDSHGNLREATLPDGRVIAYTTDGFHRRVQKRINGTVVQQFVYLDQLEPHAELDGAGNVVANFVYADRAYVPSLMRKDGRWYRIVSDQLGSVRLVVDLTDGTIAQRLDYDEFGRVLTDTQPGFQPFGYAGGIYDRDTGLVRFGARDYDPATGRWTAKDPAGFGGGENFYLYGFGDPLNRIDPTGEVAPIVFYGGIQYARCVASCTAFTAAGTALLSECDVDLLGTTGDCALECLNPLNWAKIGKSDDLLRIARSESKVWKELKNFRDGIRTNGQKGKDLRFYDWDHTHGDIEVYDRRGRHLGTMDPRTGSMIKPPVPGRTINL